MSEKITFKSPGARVASFLWRCLSAIVGVISFPFRLVAVSRQTKKLNAKRNLSSPGVYIQPPPDHRFDMLGAALRAPQDGDDVDVSFDEPEDTDPTIPIPNIFDFDPSKTLPTGSPPSAHLGAGRSFNARDTTIGGFAVPTPCAGCGDCVCH